MNWLTKKLNESNFGSLAAKVQLAVVAVLIIAAFIFAAMGAYRVFLP